VNGKSPRTMEKQLRVRVRKDTHIFELVAYVSLFTSFLNGLVQIKTKNETRVVYLYITCIYDETKLN
jgi:hypothetical protein